MIDIILVVICAYVFYQLFNVLGQRPPGDGARTRPNPLSAAMARAGRDSAPRHTPPKKPPLEPSFLTQHPEAEGVLRKITPPLSPLDFLQGAAAAFDLITRAYCAGDREVLGRLVESKLFKSFDQSIQQREVLGHQEVLDELTLLRISFEKAWIKGSMAHVCVRIISQQKRDILNAQGHYVDVAQVDANAPVVDLWTFCRPLQSDDPTWSLKQALAAS